MLEAAQTTTMAARAFKVATRKGFQRSIVLFLLRKKDVKTISQQFSNC